MNNKESLELLKQSQAIYKLANQEYLTYSNDYERDFTAVKAIYDEKQSELEAERDAEIRKINQLYKDKLKEVKKDFQEATAPLKSREKKYEELSWNAHMKGTAYHSEVEKFIKKHNISDEQMTGLLEKETDKKWKVVRTSHSGSFGYDSVLNTRYFDLGLKFYLINSDHKDFDGNFTEESTKEDGCYQIIDDYFSTLSYYNDMELARKSFVNNYTIDWMLIFLKTKGFVEHKNRPAIVANQEITNLICQAIENQYFVENESENA